MTHWHAVRSTLKNALVPLFLDYDGTLAPIVDDPERAFLSKEIRRTLNELRRVSSVRMAIISGRALKDVQNKVRVQNIVYAGNHGLEMEGPSVHYRHPIPKAYFRALALLRTLLHELTVSRPEILVENKGLTLSVHYRRLQRRDVPAFLREVRLIVDPYSRGGRVRLRPGKRVLEIRPPVVWDKGKAVEWLLDRWAWKGKGSAIVPVFIGDDRTDEDAFAVIRKNGLAVRVGRSRRSKAQYYLNGPENVSDFLAGLLCVKKDGK